MHNQMAVTLLRSETIVLLACWVSGLQLKSQSEDSPSCTQYNGLSEPLCGGYLIALPSVIVRNSTTNVCFTFHGIQDNVHIKLSLRIATRPEIHDHEDTFLQGKGRCVSLFVPEFISRRRAELTAKVTVMSSPPIELPSTSRGLRVIIRNVIAFIQTDKPVYLPESTVRFRIFAMHMNFTPSRENITMVTVRNADGYVVKHWQDVQTNQGIADLDLEITRYTKLGQWRITCVIERQEFMTVFSVIEYVLPKFEVILEAPRRLSAEHHEFNMYLCVKYVYNKPVTGSYVIQACSGGICQYTSGLISGCKMVTMATPVNPLLGGLLVDSVSAIANVTDSVNGETLSSEMQTISVTKQWLVMDIQSNSPAYFKPGIPYHGKVAAVYLDSSPAANVDLIVKVFHKGDPPESIMRERHSMNITTDQHGIAVFMLPQISNLVDSFSIKVMESQRITGWQEEETILHVKRWYSPTGSYIQTAPIRHLPSCSRRLSLNMTYIWSGNQPYNVTLYTQLITNNGLNTQPIEKQVFLWPAISLATNALSNKLLPFSDQDKLLVGDTPRLRQLVDRWKNFVVIPNSHPPIGHYGYVTQWRFFSVRSMKQRHMRFLNSDKVYLQIWRPVNLEDMGIAATHQLVGQTPATYTNKGMYVIELEGRQRIKVHPGDILGLYLPRRNPVPFDARDCLTDDMAVVIRNPSRMNIGEAYEFREIKPSKYLPCREYSVQATIEIDNSIIDTMNTQILPRYLGLNLTFDQPITGQSRLLLYYVTPEGETVADTLRLPDDDCLSNKVDVNFTAVEAYPGSTVGYDITADEGSVCALAMVDRSVQVLQPRKPLDKQAVYERRHKEIEHRTEPLERSCTQTLGSPLADTLDAFQDSGLAVLTNLGVENRPCAVDNHGTADDNEQDVTIDKTEVLQTLPAPARPLSAIDTNEGQDYGDDNNVMTREDIFALNPALAIVAQRFYFPETWLWHLHAVGPSGRVSAETKLPHSLTTWQGNSICMNDVTGLGVSRELNIRAFQPFFLSVSAPFSVINQEFLEVKLTVNSYLDQCFALTVEMEPPGGFALANGNDNVITCLCGRATQTFTYILQALVLGKHDLKYKAYPYQGLDRTICNTSVTVDKAYDSVSTPVIVKAEGIEDEYSSAELLCPIGYDQEITQAFNLSLPQDYVKGSELAQLHLIADVMGPTLFHAHKLLRNSLGTGEQIAARLAVNVIALEYLQTTSQLTDKHQNKALRLIESGYQQQLAFRRDDGSYSNFGVQDEVGSLWLTAFVIRTFALVRRYMYVDYADFEQSVGWIKSKQDDSGCFVPVGMVHWRSVKGGLRQIENSGSHVPLTAYIIAALLKAGASKFDPVVDEAMRCLETETPSDVYSLATLAYAFSVYDGDDFRVQRYLDKLRNLKTKEGGYEYWKVEEDEPDVITPMDIETTGYTLSAILARGRRQDIMEGSRIVRWLTNHRTSKGGFKSTQDTVVAIEALSRYASLTYLQDVDMNVVLEPESLEGDKVSIQSERRLVVNQWVIHDLPKRVKVKVTGIGCLLVQTSVGFNRAPVLGPKPHFGLDVSTSAVSHHRSDESDCPRYRCWHRKLQICTRYTGPHSTAEFALMEVGLVSGWYPTELSLYELKQQTEHYHSHRFNPYQTLESRNLIVIFRTVPRSRVCIDIIVEQMSVVKLTKEAIIRVYEHNYKHHQASQSYGISEVCTKEEENMACMPGEHTLEWSP